MLTVFIHKHRYELRDSDEMKKDLKPYERTKTIDLNTSLKWEGQSLCKYCIKKPFR